MEQGDDSAWLSLLQRRAEYARKAAASARSEAVAKEFTELAALYDGIAGRAQAEALPEAKQIGSREDSRTHLIKHLQLRAHRFMLDARGVSDRKRADELRYLSGAFGAEAVRLKNDNMR